MSIVNRWYDQNKTVILSETAGKVGWDDYYCATKEIEHMMQNVLHRVDIISLRHDDVLFPREPGVIQLQKASRNLPANYGISVIIGRQCALTCLYSRALGRKILEAQSVQEALDLIQRDRSFPRWS
jgi:hypothetical protein